MSTTPPVDTSGMDLARVRALTSFADAGGLRMQRGEERDVEVTDEVMALVGAGALAIVEEYPDPSQDEPPAPARHARKAAKHAAPPAENPPAEDPPAGE
jgi:hypothetical protein